MRCKSLTFLCCIFLYANSLSATSKADIEVVVFDFGGVIAKANTSQIKSFFTERLNISESELSIALRDMQAYVSKGGTERKFWERYAITNEKKLPPDWFCQYDDILREAIVEIPKTILIVKELQKQGYTTAMLSDVTEHQAKIIRKMGYYNLFCPVLLSCETGAKKPDPMAFRILLKELNRAPTRLLFIDDRNENVEAAKQEGIDAIQFISPDQLLEELATRGFDIKQID